MNPTTPLQPGREFVPDRWVVVYGPHWEYEAFYKERAMAEKAIPTLSNARLVPMMALVEWPRP